MRHQEALEARVDKTPVDITKLKPSELIELALADLEWVEKQPGYQVNMEVWHSMVHDMDANIAPVGTCLVCLAGSVMAHSLNTLPSVEFAEAEWFDDFDKDLETDGCLYALDYFRRGLICRALDHMRIDVPDALAITADVVRYEENSVLFKSDMRKIINLLQEHDL